MGTCEKLKKKTSPISLDLKKIIINKSVTDANNINCALNSIRKK